MSVLKSYGASDGPFPSKTWRIANGRILGTIDGLEAVRQAAELALSTERFQFPIYSNDYGAEFSGLIGKRRGFVAADIQRRVEEALFEDDRIEGIKGFTIDFQGDTVRIKFAVISSEGSFEMERGVTVG